MAKPTDVKAKRQAPTRGGAGMKQKRKRHLETTPDEVPNKKQNTGSNSSTNMAQPTQDRLLEPHEAFLAKLRGKYDVHILSVISSSKIEQRVTRLLEHLSQFHPSDMSVLPGVVMVHARSPDAPKLVSVIEIVRLRVHQSGQKWYQYNRVYDVEREAPTAQELPSVIEDTVMEDTNGKSRAADKKYDSDEGAFEPMPARFVEAVTKQPSTTSLTNMSVFLSRVPIPELRSEGCFTLQTNEAQIDEQRRVKMG